jgi:hypothetical protein
MILLVEAVGLLRPDMLPISSFNLGRGRLRSIVSSWGSISFSLILDDRAYSNRHDRTKNSKLRLVGDVR